jgi:ATP-dependent exoDNAse (exonuclease V) beta subunit
MLATGKTEIKKIVAVTFTEKAAGELEAAPARGR